MADRWLPNEEIVARLGVKRATSYNWIIRKKMPAHKAGGLREFLAPEVAQWVKWGRVAENTSPGAKPAAGNRV